MDWLLSISPWIALLTLAGGLVALQPGRGERAAHLSVALAAGLLVGVLGLHLLPEVFGHGEHAEHSGETSFGRTLACVAIGALGLFAVERFLRRLGRGERHGGVGRSTTVALSLHALAAGVSLGVVASMPALRAPILTSILAHKLAEGFALVAALRLAGAARGRATLQLAGFSLVTPLGAALGVGLRPSEEGAGTLAAIAAGSFVYVVLGEMLPELLHHRRDVGLRCALAGCGALLAFLLLHFAG